MFAGHLATACAFDMDVSDDSDAFQDMPSNRHKQNRPGTSTAVPVTVKAATAGPSDNQPASQPAPVINQKKRGRPAGSKNKLKLGQASALAVRGKGRGRGRGRGRLGVKVQRLSGTSASGSDRESSPTPSEVEKVTEV